MPEISGCEDLPVGKSFNFDLTAELLYQFVGSQDPTEVEGYEWELLTGTNWNLTAIDQGGINNKIAQVVTDNQNEGVIRVRALSHCGSLVSNWQYCYIGRFVVPPCPIIGAPAYVICGATDEIGLLATTTAGLTGYTYHWTYPSGWSGPATGVGVSATPNGANGGIISLEAHAFGLVSTPCNVSISLETIEPSTQAIGPDPLCSVAGLYKLDIDPPSGSTTTWAVTPSNATTVSSGSGFSVNLTANSNYNGVATIIFTVSTACGNATRELEFFIGKPKFLYYEIDGIQTTFLYVCPSGRLSHYVLVTLQADDDGCVDNWDDHGTTATSAEFCTEFDFTLQYNQLAYPPYNCAFITATASNDCPGSTSMNFLICPSYNACEGRSPYNFVISPNPAKSDVKIQLSRNIDGQTEKVSFDYLELISNEGDVLSKYDVSSESIEINISKLPEGLYYLRTWIDQGYVMEELLIER